MTEETHPYDQADASVDGPASAAARPEPGGPQAGAPGAAGPDAALPPASELEPLPVPMRHIVEVGILGWVVALVVVLLVPALHEGDRDWWPWTCVAGILLGGIGWTYLRRGRGNAKGTG